MIFELEILISFCFKFILNYMIVIKVVDCMFKIIKLNNFKIVIYIYFKNCDVYFFL